MRKLLAVAVLELGSAGVLADANKAKAFDCMDAKTFEIDSQCMANTINNNLAFAAAQQNIVLAAEENSGNAMATVSYFPQLQLIEVVAHQDATLAKNTQTPKN